MENLLTSNNNTVKSRIIRAVAGFWIVIVISILIPIVYLKSGVFFRPAPFGFLRRWLSPPYIYVVLNLVIILIVASPSLLRSLLRIFSYFKESRNGKSDATSREIDDASESLPPSSVVATKTNTTSDDGHFYQDWQDFIHGQTPTSLSLPIETEPFVAPWPDRNEVASSMQTPSSIDGRESVMEERNFAKIVKGRAESLSALPLTINERKYTNETNDDDSFESMWKTIKGIEEIVPSHPLTGNKGDNLHEPNSEDTLSGTWKAFTKGEDTFSSPSMVRHGDATCTGTEENNNTSEFNADETMDTTWNTIMRRGETVSPLSLSFKESERITVASRLASPRVPRQDAFAAWRELRKSETFNETVSVHQRAGLRRDPSLSLDDLNIRVESFIKNFNHQMWLQRQESEQRFIEMINSGG